MYLTLSFLEARSNKEITLFTKSSQFSRRCPAFPDPGISCEKHFSLEQVASGEHLYKRCHSDSHPLLFVVPLSVDKGLITKMKLRIDFAKGHSRTVLECSTCRSGLLKGNLDTHRNE